MMIGSCFDDIWRRLSQRSGGAHLINLVLRRKQDEREGDEVPGLSAGERGRE